MIALLRGRVASRGVDHAIIDVHGVGYLVHMPAPQVAGLPDAQDVSLHIATIVREDAITLYGFLENDGRDAFDVLRAVTGIGPKLSLSILSELDLGALDHAVSHDDIGALSRVSGVGRKTASRMCLELKGKLPQRFSPTAQSSGRPTPPDDPLPLALARLDYKKSEIDTVLGHPDVPSYGDAPVADRLSAALRVLARPM